MTTAVSPSSTALRSSLLRVLDAPPPPKGSLVETLLRAQQDMTAVERFAHLHEQGKVDHGKRRYESLLPSARPGPGQQYAFEVNLDSCTGCKACVAACHNLNGLDDAEVWRTVGLLHGGTVEAPVQQTVTTACHHCVDPACMLGCPVQAYEKDPVTGIVRHLDDQCIGCQYCTLMCPYDAPKFNKRQGIVRKCDMCTDRLAADEAPACVQGCPNEAIRIRVVDQVSAVQASEAGTFLPGAPAPDHTVPTTIYKTTKADAPHLLPADLYRVSPEHSHPPLVIMLVLTQLAVGAFAFDGLTDLVFGRVPHGLLQSIFATAVALIALGASTLHLGRPQYAFRVVLGLRTSWLSREAVAFGIFAKLAVMSAATSVLTTGALSAVGLEVPDFPGRAWLVTLGVPFQIGAILLGLVGVFCSVMVYVVTRRAHWRLGVTGLKFLGTTVVLGAAGVYAVSALFGADGMRAGLHEPSIRGRLLLWTLIFATAGKVALEAWLLRHTRDREHTALKRMALLMVRDLRAATLARFVLAMAGGIVLPAVFLTTAPVAADGILVAGATVALLVASLGGELLERYLFFAAAPASRMPGALS